MYLLYLDESGVPERHPSLPCLLPREATMRAFVSGGEGVLTEQHPEDEGDFPGLGVSI
jgi:hypothetical protein